MIKYILAAQALKFFSLNTTTENLYRRLGNLIGGNVRKTKIPSHYIERANNNLNRIEQYNGIKDGMKILELGTGWVHWESLYISLFYDVEVIAFDVWDNRQLLGFKTYASQLLNELHNIKRPEKQLNRAKSLLKRLKDCDNFDDIYEILNITYLIDETGSLKNVSDDSIDLIYSSDVLEHIPIKSVGSLFKDMHRVLKVNGLSAHWVVPFDHLTIYDSSLNGKNYLQYSEKKWKLLFENKVQYINRLQMSEWVELFNKHSFKLIHCFVEQRTDISELHVSNRFSHLSNDDLECGVFSIIGQK